MQPNSLETVPLKSYLQVDVVSIDLEVVVFEFPKLSAGRSVY